MLRCFVLSVERTELSCGDQQRTKQSKDELKEGPSEAEAVGGPGDAELEAAMVEILKDAKDDFSIKDLLNKLREWSFLARISNDLKAAQMSLARHTLPLPTNMSAMTLQAPCTRCQVPSMMQDIVCFIIASS